MLFTKDSELQARQYWKSQDSYPDGHIVHFIGDTGPMGEDVTITLRKDREK